MPVRSAPCGRISRCESRCSRSQTSWVSTGGARQVGDHRADGDDLDAARVVGADQAAVVGAELARTARARPAARVPLPAPSGAPSRGSGYQTSRTVPDRVTVARPAATAERGAASVTVDDGTEPSRQVARSARRGRWRVRPHLGSAAVSALPELDLSADVLTLTRALVDAPSVSGDGGRAGRRRRGRPARARRAGGRAGRRLRPGPHEPGPAEPRRARRAPGHRADRRQRAQPARRRPAVRLRHQRHEVRRRGDPAAGRPLRRPRARSRRTT